MASGNARVLVTGASGLVGGEAAALLRSTCPDATVVPLGRSASNGIVANLADAALPDLPRDVTHILHCAADTRFGRPIDEVRAVNVEGTRRLLAFARTCPRLQAFIHVSTAYVCGLDAGPVPEAPLPRPSAFANTYQQSKWEAEQLVIGAMPHMPASVVRISSIFGDSATGAVKQFNYTHQLLKLLGRNVLPVAPLDLEAPVDLAPLDWVAPRLVELLFERFVPGGVRHLCAGAALSITAGEMVDRAVRGYERHPAGQKWLPVRLPRFVTLDEWAGFREEAEQGSDRLLKEVMRLLDYFLPHLALRQLFATSVQPPAPAVREYFDKVVDECLSRNWGA